MFYVYAYLDPRKSGSFNYEEIHFDYEPFYIGKGKGNRDQVHLIEKESGNRHKHNKIQQIIREGFTPVIMRLREELSEQEAWDFEKRLVDQIGRGICKTGPLTNLQDGGTGGFSHVNTAGLLALLVNKYGEAEGNQRYSEILEKRGSGWRGVPLSKERKKRLDEGFQSWRQNYPEQISEIAIKRYQDHPDLRNIQRETFAKTKKNSPEKFGLPQSEATKCKISEAQKGKRMGSESPSYGKSPHQRMIEKYGVEEGERRYTEFLKNVKEANQKAWKNNPERHKRQSESHKGLMKGKENPNYGKSVYQRMINKYGVEEGEKKFEEYRQKLREGHKRKKESG